jgi:hypothetical protein
MTDNTHCNSVAVVSSQVQLSGARILGCGLLHYVLAVTIRPTRSRRDIRNSRGLRSENTGPCVPERDVEMGFHMIGVDGRKCAAFENIAAAIAR